MAHIISAQGDPNPHRYLHEGIAVYMEELFVKDRFLAHYPGGAHKYSARKKEHLVPLEELDIIPLPKVTYEITARKYASLARRTIPWLINRHAVLL